MLELALEQLPESALDGEILARSDSAGGSHDFASGCRECRIRFSLSHAINNTVREQILDLPEDVGRRRSTRTMSHATGHGWPSSPALSTWTAGLRALG